MDRIAGLRKHIAGIEHFSWGQYSSPEGLNQGYQYGFEMLFTNAEARNAYSYHLEHVKVADYVLSILEKHGGKSAVVAFDYEIT